MRLRVRHYRGKMGKCHEAGLVFKSDYASWHRVLQFILINECGCIVARCSMIVPPRMRAGIRYQRVNFIRIQC